MFVTTRIIYRNLPRRSFSTCVVALGSNIGERVTNIRRGLEEMKKFAEISSTSFLYETVPLYLEDQPKFLNAACKLQTNISPQELLKRLKGIEVSIGRVSSTRYGPRLIDLDIVFYDTEQISTPTLQIPHPLFSERDFVLRPLLDIVPDFVVPIFGKSVFELHTDFIEKRQCEALGSELIQRVWPVGPAGHLWHLGHKTYIMGIVNVTPDSFSDGGDFVDVDRAVAHAEEMFTNGADIVDIGGESTRPGAGSVNEEEELRRVIPVIQKIKERFPDKPISIDTYRSNVVLESVRAGATVVNDIRSGVADPNILSTVAELGVPYIMMHMRGTPQTMQSNTNYKNLTEDVRNELGEFVSRCESHGIPLWDLMVDPGIGFAKDAAQCVQLLKQLDEITPRKGLPILSGPSRKSFLRPLIGEASAKDRIWGTAAAVTASIEKGADVVRVHDVAEMRDVVKVSDAIYRSHRL